MDGSTAMLAEHSNFLYVAAVALILVILRARRATRKDTGIFKSVLFWRTLANDRSTDRMFERHHIQALKKCPNCKEQLPLSTLICEACDHNFLTGMLGPGQRLLPTPEPRVHEIPARILAYRA
jgi:hypothetical protein